MASPQFLHLLKQLHKTAERRPLPWQPIRQYAGGGRCDFRIALGDGIVRIETNDADPHENSVEARCTAYLTTRDGLIVDEVAAQQHESDYYPFLRELYQQAHIAAFELSRMVDGMQADLEAGKVRDLPKDEANDGELPF